MMQIKQDFGSMMHGAMRKARSEICIRRPQMHLRGIAQREEWNGKENNDVEKYHEYLQNTNNMNFF